MTEDDEMRNQFNRDRSTLEVARNVANNLIHDRISHLLDNGDGTYSVMCHIVCEWCDYCDSQGDCRLKPDCVPVPYQDDPYQGQEI